MYSDPFKITNSESIQNTVSNVFAFEIQQIVFKYFFSTIKLKNLVHDSIE